ncbi:hypothetical protein ACV229_38865 [Burkholderia sp. MR1-5-21]
MTFGISKDPRLDMHLNNGMFNGRPIYIHYTSQAGHTAIAMQRCIMGTPNAARRGARAQPGVYLALAKDAMNGERAHQTLFLGADRYRLSATHCFIFTFNADPFLSSQPVSQGSTVDEVIYPGNIPFRSINVIYDGRNPFL